jgi:hypothetical protein
MTAKEVTVRVQADKAQWLNRAVCRPSHPHPLTKRFDPLEDALQIAEKTWERWLDAELYRRKG